MSRTAVTFKAAVAVTLLSLSGLSGAAGDMSLDPSVQQNDTPASPARRSMASGYPIKRICPDKVQADAVSPLPEGFRMMGSVFHLKYAQIESTGDGGAQCTCNFTWTSAAASALIEFRVGSMDSCRVTANKKGIECKADTEFK